MSSEGHTRFGVWNHLGQETWPSVQIEELSVVAQSTSRCGRDQSLENDGSDEYMKHLSLMGKHESSGGKVLTVLLLLYCGLRGNRRSDQ